jgi:hypothetical protein
MEIKDFVINEENSYKVFEADTFIWCENVSILLDFGDIPANEAALKAILPEINRKIQFINDNRKAIEQSMLDDDMVELAEDWASSAEEDENEEDCYIMEDGQKVCLPISEEDFLKSLHFDGLNLSFSKDTEKSFADLFFSCNPDYFAHHSIEIFIDEDDNIKCNSLIG